MVTHSAGPLRIPGSTIGRQVLWLSGPVLIQQTLIYLIGLSDTILAGRHFSEEQLAGVTVASYLLWFFSSLLTVVSAGATALVARSVGADHQDEARHFCSQAFLLGLGVSFAILFVVEVFAAQFAAMMNLTGEAGSSAAQFLRIVGAITPLLGCTIVGNACLRGTGDTRTGMQVMMAMNVINITATWSLALGLGPIPPLGLRGIALGTALGEAIGGVLMLAALRLGRSGLVLRAGDLHFDRQAIHRLLRISIPAAGDSLSNVICQLWFLSLIDRLGSVATAAHGVAIRCEAIAFLTITAFSVAAATLTGQYLGAGRPDLAIRAARSAWGYGALTLATLGLLLYFEGDTMFRFFLSDRQPGVRTLGVPVLKIVAIAMPALATISVLTAALGGAGDTRWPWLFTLSGYLLVRIPLTMFFIGTPQGGGLGLGLKGAWLAMFVDLHFRAALVAARFIRRRWVETRV